MRLGTALALAGIIVAGALLRFPLLGQLPPGLYPDEATNGNDALRALEGGPSWFYPANGGREGLFVNLQAAALAVADAREPWVLRAVSALVGLLAIPGMYVLGAAAWGRRTGLLAAALLAGSFWHVHFSRIGFRAILAVTLLAWSLGLLLAGIRRLRDGAPHGATLAVLGGAVAGLGLHSYIAFRAAAIPLLVTGAFAIWHARRGARKRVARTVLLGGAAALLVAAPMLHHFATHPGSFSGRSSAVSAEIADVPGNLAREVGMLFVRGDGNWRHGYPPQPAVPALLAPLLACGIWLVASRTWKTRGRELGDAAVLATFLAALLPAVLSSEGVPHALRGILLVVPAYLAVAFAITTLWNRMRLQGWRYAGAVLAVCAVAYSFWHTVAVYPAYATRNETRDEFTADYVALGRELLSRDHSRPAYVLVPRGDVLVGGIPTAAQTVMFITGTATREAQEREEIFYVTDEAEVPPGADAYRMR